ncbi:HAD family hydrolase [Spiroplasma endosymbiont of Crioceris asparagi]|uniref:HAD family hydrolase n=1 Tax=Spiroplasma endosymbiont of Crioceris asparagi TaxID=3066286 RepID=UPI0030D38BA1
MIKLLFLDLDGTLLNKSGEVTKETLEAIRKGRRYGIKVCIATGRSISRTKPLAKFIDGFKFDDYVICLNGSKIYKFTNDILNQVESHPIIEEDAQMIFKKANDLGLTVLGYGEKDTKYYTNKRFSLLSMFVKRTSGLQPIKYKGEKLLDESISKFLIKGNNEKLNKMKKFLTKKEFEWCGSSYASDKSIEVSKKNINKLTGVKFVAKELGIEAKDIAYFGDGANDIKALKWVGHSYAMGNAIDEVKEVAKFRALSNNENGIIEPLEKYAAQLESTTVSSNTVLSDFAEPQNEKK